MVGPCLRKSGPMTCNPRRVNPSLHTPAQQAGAAQVINAPPKSPPRDPITQESSQQLGHQSSPLPSTSQANTARSKNIILYSSENCQTLFISSSDTQQTKSPIMSFEKAIADSKKLTSKPSNEELLDLYGMPRWLDHESGSLSCPLATVLTTA